MDNSGSNAGAINFYSGPSTGGSNYTISNASIGNYLRMTILNNKVGIGMANPDAALAVAGTIHSQSVLVDMVGWNDYVFQKDYHLQTLSEIKRYVEENHHLPDVPSESEIVKSGLDIGKLMPSKQKKSKN